jgi:Zn-finger nucleic acid-binding protein
MDPFRDPELPCPACARPLRAFQQRLVCDACGGILLALADLAAAIEDLTSVAPTFAWSHEHQSSRACPQCRAAMTAGRIVLHLEEATAHPRPELDRCATHGVWFDPEELAKVLEKVTGKGHGSKVVSKVSSRRESHPDKGWSAMFPKFGGRGGF